MPVRCLCSSLVTAGRQPLVVGKGLPKGRADLLQTFPRGTQVLVGCRRDRLLLGHLAVLPRSGERSARSVVAAEFNPAAFASVHRAADPGLEAAFRENGD